MAIILKDFNHVTVVDGELVPSSNEFDLADLLGNFDYKRIIKMQFDRLDTSFQEILTVRQSTISQFFFSLLEGVRDKCRGKNPSLIKVIFRSQVVWINTLHYMRSMQ